jgi:hypothetical protein
MWDLVNKDKISTDLFKWKEEQLYKSEIVNRKKLEKYPNSHVKHIKDDVYWVYRNKWELAYFCKVDWEIILSIWWLRELQFVVTWEAILWSWFFEKKEWTTYKLYKVLWFDKDDKPVLERNPIDPYSKEYYKAWRDIDFNATLLGKTLLKNNPTSLFSKEELKILEKDLTIDIKTWAILIDDLEILLEQKKITKVFFEISVQKIIKEHLLNQCSDTRLDEVKQWITEVKLKHYAEKWYLKDPKLAENCLLAIRAKETKKKEERKIIDDAGDGVRKIR